MAMHSLAYIGGGLSIAIVSTLLLQRVTCSWFSKTHGCISQGSALWHCDWHGH